MQSTMAPKKKVNADLDDKPKKRVDTDLHDELKERVDTALDDKPKKKEDTDLDEEPKKRVDKDLDDQIKKVNTDLDSTPKKEFNTYLGCKPKKKVDTDLHDELKKKVDTDLDDELKKKVDTDLHDELKKKVDTDLDDELKKKVGTDLDDELKKKVDTDLHDELKKKVGTDLDDELKKKVDTDLHDALKKRVDTDLDGALEQNPKKDTRVFQGVEWTIENLSCWDKDIHDISFTCLTTGINPELIIRLYPRGLSGEGKNIGVKICGKVASYFSGELSFYDSEGSLLCKHDIKRLRVPRRGTRFFKGPVYKNVVGRVFGSTDRGRLTVRVWNEMSQRKMSPRCPESITVREGYNVMQYKHTAIDEYDIPLKLPPGVFRRLGKTGTEIARIGYYIDNPFPFPKELIVSASENDKLISLSVRPLELSGKILVHARLTVVHDDCEKTESNRHVFGVEENWTFSESLTREVVKREGFSLNLRFKIIPSIFTNDCVEILKGFSTYVNGNALM